MSTPYHGEPTQLVREGLQALLVVVFLAAAIGKAHSRASFRAFTAEVGLYPGVPAAAAPVLAVATVTAEAVAIALTVLSPRAGGLALALLVAVLTVATLLAGKAGDCACFGEPAALPGVGTLAYLSRNALLLLAAVTLAALPAGSASVAPTVVALAVGATAGITVTRWDDLWYLLA